MVPKFFRAAAFAANVFGDMGAGDTNWLGAECEDLTEAAWAQPFLARFLQCCLYWLFCIKHVCTKAGVFVFGAVGKAGHAVSFSLDCTKMLSPLSCGGLGFCFKQASVISSKP